ncbi:MAG: hypothetical protein ACP5UT_11710 [Bryobacteraceae bacterium]
MYFPVLQSGVYAQFPVSKTDEYSIIEEETPGGGVWRLGTGRATVRRWRLELEEVSDEEALALIQFYDAVRGGWHSFSFADPMGNLLVWSENLGKPSWLRSPGVSVTPAGPLEGGPAEFLIVNGGAAPGEIWQELDLAPGAAVCFSCETQTPGGPAGGVFSAGAENRIVFSAGWNRIFVTGTSSGGFQRVGIRLEPGAALRVRRLQAEIQIAPSEYRPTFEVGGVWPKTRFAQDGLTVIATAPGRNRIRILLESAMESVL